MMKQNAKRFLSFLLALLLCLELLPERSYAADENPYLTFTANTAGSSVTLNYSTGTVQYSLNGGAWETYTCNAEISLSSAGDSVRFKGTEVTTGPENHFSMSGSIAASGDVTSLTNGTGGNATLSNTCYCFMFDGCTALTAAPSLPSETLETKCYSNMFSGCTSLTTAPALPATALASYCYSDMFSGCTSLTTAPVLPATTLAISCYRYMFSGCTSLTTAPALPATALATRCYSYMFSGCTALKVLPALSATTLANHCYQGMFSGCTGISLYTYASGFSGDTTWGIPETAANPLEDAADPDNNWKADMFKDAGTIAENAPEPGTLYTYSLILKKLTVTAPPVKTVYTAWEDFDPAGMTVTAFYSDGSSKDVTGYVSIADSEDLRTGRTSVTVSYKENGITLTAEQEITVNPGIIFSVSAEGFTAPVPGQTVETVSAKQAGLSPVSAPDTPPVSTADGSLTFLKVNDSALTEALSGGTAPYLAYRNSEEYSETDMTAMSSEDTFDEGNAYLVSIRLQTEDASFSGNCIADVNGSYVISAADGTFCTLFILCDFTAPREVTLLLEPNGGSCESTSVTTGTDGKAASLPEASAQDAVFGGWYDVYGNKITADTVFYGDTSLYAHYEASEMLNVTLTGVPEPAAGKTKSQLLSETDEMSLTALPTVAAYDVSIKNCYKVNNFLFTTAFTNTSLTDAAFFEANDISSAVSSGKLTRLECLL